MSLHIPQQGKHSKPWPDAEVKAMLELYNQGATVDELTKAMKGRNRRAVSTKLTRLGYSLRGR